MLKNDKGYSEDDPCGFFCTVYDVESWGRVHMAVRAAVGQLLQSGDDFGAERGPAQAWYEDSEKYDGLANTGLGFSTLADFGVAGNEELVMQSIASTKEGKRILGVLRGIAGVQGGDDIGGVAEEPSTVGKEIRIFGAGAALAALAYVGWRAYREWG